MDESIRRKRIQVQKQREALEQALRDGDGALMTEDRVRIVRMDPMELVGSLRDGHVSALQVLRAFQSKGLELTKEINCITEFIPEAEVWAKECDETPAEERGPLHGVPVSIKDNIDVQGMDSTMGLAKHLFKPASSHAAVVEVLRRRGAVPFCKTNVPQTLLSFSCSNPVFGETRNPHDYSRSPGGSSGGEAALIGGGGSVLGIGSDLAGSARIPASFSGCVGIKPTLKRVSTRGCMKALEGMVGNSSTVGIMGRDCSIVAACLKVLVDSEEMCDLDLFVVPIPWRETKFIGSSKKLVFGYFDDLDAFPTTPGVKRAVHLAKHALMKAGHEVVPFQIEDSAAIFRDIMSVLSADGGNTIVKHIKNEHVDVSLERGMKVTTTPEYLKPLMKFYLGLKSPIAADVIQTSCSKSYGLWKQLLSRERKTWEISQMLKEKGIDLVLSPAYAVPATQQFVPPLIATACTYSVLFNFLDFPSGCVPVTFENEADQRLLEDYPETDALFRLAKQATRGASGLPIGVLISGPCWEEELVLKGMVTLEQALKLSDA